MLQVLWARKHSEFRRALLWALAGAALLLFSAGSSRSWAQAVADGGLPDAFAVLSQSVGALYQKDGNGNLAFSCTVTVVAHEMTHSVLLTAGHCASRNTSYAISLDGARFYGVRPWKLSKAALDPKFHRPYREPEVDIALLVTDEVLPVPAVSFAEGYTALPGTEVLMVGFPLGVTKVRYAGIIAGQLDQPGSDQHTYLILQIFGAPGNSGSAIVDRLSGKIAGVLSAGKQDRAGLPVIFAVPAHYRTLLQDVETPVKP